MKKALWFGETKCDCCKHEITDMLHDAPTVWGPWGTLCNECFHYVGKGGGFVYKKNQNGEFEKMK